MTLNRDRAIVRWAYLGERKAIPLRTSLCAIFWRSVLFSPAKCVAVAAVTFDVIYVTVRIIAFFFHFNWQTLLWGVLVVLAGVAVALSIFALIAGVAFVGEKLDVPQKARSLRERVDDSVLVNGFKAWKSKVCPIVDLI